MDIQAIIFNFEKAPDAEVRATLCTLRRRGYKLAANCVCGACDALFESDGEDLREAYLRAAKKLGVPPEECAVAEGVCEHLLFAKDCGMGAIGVGTAQNCIYADTGVRDIAELLSVFA